MSKKSNDPRVTKLQALVTRYERIRSGQSAPFFSPEEFEDLLVHFFDQNDYDKTLEVADFALSRYAYTPEFYKWKALIHKINLEEDEAMAVLDKLATYAPNNDEVLLLRLEVYVHFQHVEPAREVLDQLLMMTEEDHKVSLLAYYDGLLWLEEHNPAEAYRALSWSIRLDPYQEAAYDELLNAEELEPYVKQTGKLLRKLTDRDPFNDLAWYYLGVWYDDRGQDAEARDAFANARSLNGDRAAYDLEYADKLFDLDQYEEALSAYGAYLASDEAEDSYETYMRIGRSHQLLERGEAARKAFMRAQELSPDAYDVYQHLGECWVAEERWAMAAYYYGLAVEQPNHTPHCWLGLALCNAALNQYQEAEAAFLRATDLDNRCSDAHVTYALFLAEQNRQPDALEALREARAQYRDASLLYGTVAVLFACQRRQEALAFLNEALSEFYADNFLLLDWNPALAEDADVRALLALHQPRS